VTDSHHTSELPKGWAWTELKEIAIEINSGFPSGRWKRGAENGVLHLRPMNIDTKGKIELTDVKYVQAEGYDALSKGDVIFNNTNSPELLGKTACIREDTNWAYSNHMTRIRFFPSLMEPAFIGHYLHFLFRNGYFKTRCVHHVNQASIGKDFLSKMHIPFPPSSEQKRIVTKLDELFACLDTGIEGLRKVKAQLKRYRQAVLKYAFEGKLTQDWRNIHKGQIEPATKLLEKIRRERAVPERFEKQSSTDTAGQFALPDTWTWAKLNDISMKITDGTHFTPQYVDYGTPFISVKDVFDGLISFEFCKHIAPEDHAKLAKRCNPEYLDVLITKSGTIGRTAVVKTTEPFSLFVSVALIKPFKPYIDSNYLALSLENYISSIDIQQSVKGGVIKNLHIEDLKEIVIPLAPLMEQKKIDEIAETHITMIDKTKLAVERALKQGESLRQGILKKAYEGKLVPQDPSDEPADKLLERIREERAKSMDEKDTNKTRKKNNPGQLELSSYVK